MSLTVDDAPTFLEHPRGLAVLFLTVGELRVSPVGLAALARLAPVRIIGATMAAWFLYTGISSFLAGFISRSAGTETLGGRITDMAAAKQTYVAVYGQIGALGVAIAIVMLAVASQIGCLMQVSKSTPPAAPQS